jgi:hypothetical protein
MLGWAAAAVAPILIHLWSRRRYREVTWAAMEYLLAAMKKNSRRIQFEQLLLLLIRTAILLLLAVILARPGCSGGSSVGAAPAGEGRLHTVLVLDATYSMGAKAGDKTLFQIAQQTATQLVERSQQGDGFTLVLLADPPRVVISEAAFDPQNVIEEIASLALTHTRGDASATFAEVERILDQAVERQGRLPRSRVCVLTDLARPTWEEAAADPALQRRLARLSQKASLALLELGQPQTENLAIASLESRDALLVAGRQASLEAVVRNFGEQPRKGQLVTLLVNGRPVHEERIDVGAGGQASVGFTFPLEAPGDGLIEARLPADLLEIDNHRWLAAPVRQSVEVLCVRGSPQAAQHVAYALSPETSGAPVIRPQIVWESKLLELDLRRYACVFLCNVARFSEDEAAVLREYLRSGGGLVFFLGDQVQADNYNQVLGGADERRILPAVIGEPAAAGTYHFDPLDYRHDLVSVFRGHQRSGLLTTPVWRYLRVTPHNAESARVALALTSGDPAIVEERRFRGRTIVVATSTGSESTFAGGDAAAPWTALSAWPSFPPLVHEMLSLVVGDETDRRNVSVGDELAGQAPRSTTAGAVTLELPTGQTERITLTREAEQARWSYSGTWLSGPYQVRYGSSSTATDEAAWHAVNLDPREGDLRRIAPDALPAELAREAPIASTEDAPPLPVEARQELFRPFLAALLGLLMLESALAWRWGKGS